ncbi:MAG TPA: hypothetical protein VKR23_01590, partial [Gaiellaceae bacterium]|nr:hypothetical protein [Gaiellaceae bacterium]
MAVGMLLAGEGMTRDAYVALTEKMFGGYPMRADQSPDGLIVHTAGESPMGFYIYDIWESKEHFQRFMDSMVGPAMEEIGGEGGVEPAFYEIETLVEARTATAA